MHTLVLALQRQGQAGWPEGAACCAVPLQWVIEASPTASWTTEWEAPILAVAVAGCMGVSATLFVALFFW